jgi:MFS family permease
VNAPPPTAADVAPGPSPYLHGPVAAGVVLGIFLAILLAGLDGLVVATALPTIARSLRASDGITFVTSAYLIASTVAIPIFSKLSDLSSRRNVFLIALGIFIGGSALAGLSQTLGELILFRGIQGFGSGAFLPVGIAMVALLFSPKQRTRLIGVLSGAGGIAIVGGPLLGSFIVSVTTWRWVFYVNLPLGIAAMGVLALTLSPLRPAVRGRFDLVGAASLAGWVSALMLPLVEIADGSWTWTTPASVGLLGVAAVLVGAFVVWELRQTDPLVPLRLLGRRVVAATAGISLSTGILFTSILTLLGLFVGLVLFPTDPSSQTLIRDVDYFFAVPMILGAVLAGGLLTRFSYRTVIAPALVLGGVCGLFLYGVTAATPLWVLAFGVLPVGGLVLPLIPLGFGAGIGLAGATVAIQNEVPRSEVGAGIGITRFFQSLGGAVGLSLFTVYLSWRATQGLPAVPTPADAVGAVVAAYDVVFLVLSVIMILAGLLAFGIPGRAVPASGETPARSPVGPDREVTRAEPETMGPAARTPRASGSGDGSDGT